MRIGTQFNCTGGKFDGHIFKVVDVVFHQDWTSTHATIVLDRIECQVTNESGEEVALIPVSNFHLANHLNSGFLKEIN